MALPIIKDVFKLMLTVRWSAALANCFMSVAYTDVNVLKRTPSAGALGTLTNPVALISMSRFDTPLIMTTPNLSLPSPPLSSPLLHTQTPALFHPSDSDAQHVGVPQLDVGLHHDSPQF